MALVLLWIVLWLPVVMLGAALLLPLVLAIEALRRRYPAFATMLRSPWLPGLLTAAAVVLFLWGGPGGPAWVMQHALPGDPAETAAWDMLQLQRGCADPRVSAMEAFIAHQPFARHEMLEGRLLRVIHHCAAPAWGDKSPDPGLVFSAADAAALHRIAPNHRWRPTPGAPVQTAPYRESWADDAEGVEGLLLWQEQGLDAFEAQWAEALSTRRRVYLGLAGLHCLQAQAAPDCGVHFTPPRVKALVGASEALPGYWFGALRERLAARWLPPPLPQHEPAPEPVVPQLIAH